jgi:hypothetical protein
MRLKRIVGNEVLAQDNCRPTQFSKAGFILRAQIFIGAQYSIAFFAESLPVEIGSPMQGRKPILGLTGRSYLNK